MRYYLVSLRKAKNFTQKQLSEKLDISESYYNQIENGERQKNGYNAYKPFIQGSWNICFKTD